MSDIAPPEGTDTDEVVAAIDTITGGLEKMLAGLTTLRELVSRQGEPTELDPRHPRNKHEVGGLQKLTPRGAEICYRLFDRGLSRYAVAQAMNISFGAANHRYRTWQKAGGKERKKEQLSQ